jgi:hypothetical protein
LGDGMLQPFAVDALMRGDPPGSVHHWQPQGSMGERWAATVAARRPRSTSTDPPVTSPIEPRQRGTARKAGGISRGGSGWLCESRFAQVSMLVVSLHSEACEHPA